MSNIKNVVGYENLYLVDTNGNVFSLRKWRGKTNRVLTPSKNEYGYLRVFLTKDGITKGITIHKIVTRAFLGEMPIGKQVRHIDGNKVNNALHNLVYGTALENAKDRLRHNKTAFADKIGTSKLSKYDVINIRASNLTQKELAKKYNVSIANISLIINNKSRKNG